jgi:transcriptional regulator with XRE-family HTH domain
MDSAQAFGQLLKLRRKADGLSQELLAERAGLHRTEISLIERGKRDPRLETLRQLADGLDTTLSDLLEDLDVDELESRDRRKRNGA